MSGTIIRRSKDTSIWRFGRPRAFVLSALAVLLMTSLGCGGQKPPTSASASGRLIQSFDESMVKTSPLLPSKKFEPLVVNLRKAWHENRLTAGGTTQTLRVSGNRVILAAENAGRTLNIAFPNRTAREMTNYGVLELEMRTYAGPKTDAPRNDEPGRLVWRHRENDEKEAGAVSFAQASNVTRQNGIKLYSFPLYQDKKWTGAVRSISIEPSADAATTLTLVSMRLRHVTPAEQALRMDPIDEFPERDPSPFLRAVDRGGELRNCLVAPPRTEVAWTLRVPAKASLSFGTAAMADESQANGRPRKILFSVRAVSGSETDAEELFSATQSSDAESWTDHRVSLEALAGKKVTLVFTTSSPDPRDEDRPTTAGPRPETWGFWSAPGVASAEEPRRNLAMISLDCMRADRVGLFGYSRDTTPVIDDLARKGLAFDHMYAHAGITCTSHHSILTSLYPVAHGITRTPAQLPAEVVTLAQIMRRNGYMTIALVGGGMISRDFGYAKGFDIFGDSHNGAMGSSIPRLQELLDVYGDQKLFVFLHTYDMHEPYVSDPKYMNFFDPNYKGDIAPGTLLAYDQMLRAHSAVRMECFTSDRILSCESLLKDGGFEEGDAAAPINKNLDRSAESPRRGKYCGHVPATSDPKQLLRRRSGGASFVELDVKPNSVYVFGGYMKSRDLRSSARFTVEPIDKKNPDPTRTQFITGTADWQRYVGVVKVPRTCRKARFYYPRLLNYERGELWVDDVFFVPYNSIPADMRTSETMHAISPADAKRINDLYDGSVRYVDTRVGELVKLLESRGFLQQGAFAITADHGQDLMDHRWLGHGEGFSWDSILRVPFIVYAPSLTKTPERVSKLCESVDIAPTLLTLIGIDPPRFFQGANILSSKHKKDYVFANYRKLYTIVTPDHRFRYDAERGKAELNILANDPKQRVNVAGKNPDLVREYRQLLDELVKKFTLNLKAQPATKQMSPEVRDRLKDLGYL